MVMSGKTGVFYSDVIDGYKVDAIFAVKLDDFIETARNINDESNFRNTKENQSICLTSSLESVTLN
jgi:hypothetical protein